jgi:hypothetical protein
VSTLLPEPESPFAALLALVEGRPVPPHPIALAQELDNTILCPRHLEFLSKAVARTISTPNGRLLVSMPPRHGKSETISHWSCVWALERNPRDRVLLASYEADFAATWSRKVRDTIKRYSDQLSVKIKVDSRSASRWETTAGGGMVSAGAGGPLTGRGGNILIIDDPIKNAEDAQSLTKREGVWEWWTTTARSRVEPGGSIIVVQTRWHEDDLHGHLLAEDEDRWEVITFPAIAGEVDVLGRQPGEALWPERYDVEAFKEFQLSESTWLSLYQQQPTPISHDQLAFKLETIISHEERWGCRPAAVGRIMRENDRVIFMPGKGLWSIWRPPEEGRSYIIGVDPCGDGQGRDFAHCVVVDAASGEECASMHGRISPGNLAKELVLAGWMYKCANGQPALLAVEVNGEGSACVVMLRDRHYPRIWSRQRFDSKGTDRTTERIGWYSSKQTKNLAISSLSDGLSQHDIIIHDNKVFAEMKRFARQPNGSFAATRGNDDRVMAWAITAAVRKYGSNLPRGNQEKLGSYRQAEDSTTGY